MDPKLIHDMNSSLGALEQAFELLQGDRVENSGQLIPLCHEKIQEIQRIWSLLKENYQASDTNDF